MIKGSAIKVIGVFEDEAKAIAYRKDLDEFLDEKFNLSNRIEREEFVCLFRHDSNIACHINTGKFLEYYEEKSLKQLLDILYNELVKGNIKSDI